MRDSVRRLLVLPVVCVAAASVLVPSAGAAPTHRAAMSSSAVKMDKVVVHITTTGSTVWGTVTGKYTKKGNHSVSCHKASCTWKIPAGVVVHLSQRPLNASTWPFSQWQLRSTTYGAKMRIVKTAKTTVKVTSGYSVTAVYVVA